MLVVANAVFAVLVLVVLELACRIFLSYNAPFRERMVTNVEYQPSGFARVFAEPNQTVYDIDKTGRLVRERVKFHINRYGYRGGDFPLSKKPGELRIVFIGGSHVFDLNSYDYAGNPGFPKLVETLFRRHGRNVTVINAGLPRSDTRDFAAKLVLDLYRYAPDIVVVNSVWNDTKWISRTSDSCLFLQEPPLAVRRNPLSEEAGVLDYALGWSVLYRKVRDSCWRITLGLNPNDEVNEGILAGDGDGPADLSRGLSQYQANVAAIVQLVKGMHAVPVLAVEERLVSARNTEAEKRRIQYRMVNVKSHAELVSIFERCDAILKSVSVDQGVPFLDVNSEIEKRPDKLSLFSDHVHVTPAGSRFLAERYFALLEAVVEGGERQGR